MTTLKTVATTAVVAAVFKLGGLHLGLGGVIILFVVSLIFKRDFLSLLSSGPAGTTGLLSLSLIPPAISVNSHWCSSSLSS